MTSCVGFGAGGGCTSSAGSGEVAACWLGAAGVGVGGEKNGEGTARGCGITGI